MATIASVQIGKNGITENFLETLKNYFKNHQNVKISVLKSATRNREELKKISEKIIESMGKNFTARTIGFTIVVKKWRKNMK